MVRRAPRDEPLCLNPLGDRVCVGPKDHPEPEHHYDPRPKPGRLTSNDLYLAGVRVGVIVKRAGKKSMPMKVAHVFTDGVILMRTLSVGNVFMVTGETFFKHYMIVR